MSTPCNKKTVTLTLDAKHWQEIRRNMIHQRSLDPAITEDAILSQIVKQFFDGKKGS